MINLSENKIIKLKNAIRNFLQTKLGESPSQIYCYLNNNFIAIYIHDINSLAEQKMMRLQENQKLLIDYKTQEFEIVKPDLIKRIERILDLKLNKIYSLVTEDGIRIINLRIHN
ncbi:MAG: DUF2294 family protein [Calditrichaceae bacterium]|nr:DUF2294 family protein [Calditrichaceae bacterium]MBN2708601.1 DUF2294 family protein [Calditrichaceae bacterium]RQV95452.1 MAG: DUF2294 family protein [Calditrichota bacterium]